MTCTRRGRATHCLPGSRREAIVFLSARNFAAVDWTDSKRSGREMARGESCRTAQEVFAVTIAAGSREHRNVCDADVFSWNQLPELLAAEDLFEGGDVAGDGTVVAFVEHSTVVDADEWTLPGHFVVAGEDDDDDFEDEDDDEDEDEDDDYLDEDEEEEEDDDSDSDEEDDEEWEEVDGEEDEDEDDEEDGDEDEDEEWEDEDEDWEDEDEDEDEDDDD